MAKEKPKIRVSEEVKNKLDELKINKNEPYDILIDRIIEESIIVRDEYKVFRVNSKVIKIPKKGNLLFEIPGADEDEVKLFKEAIKKRISKNKKVIIIVGKEIKFSEGTYMTYEKEIKGKLREDIRNIPKEKRNKFFDKKAWGKL